MRGMDFWWGASSNCFVELREVPLSDPALPDYEYAPTHCPKSSGGTPVPERIVFDLGAPEVLSRLRNSSLRAAWVAVPKTPMYEHGDLARLEYEIRPTWQALVM